MLCISLGHAGNFYGACSGLFWLLCVYSPGENNFSIPPNKNCNFCFPGPGTSDVIRCVSFDCFTLSQCISFKVSTL